MASKTPYDLILSKVKDAFPAYDVVEWDSLVDNMNQRSSAFLAVEDAYSDNSLLSVASPTKNWFEERGEIDVHIFVPAREGNGAARVIASSVQAELQMQNLDPSTRTLLASPPNQGIISEGGGEERVRDEGEMYATNTEHCSYILNNAHCNEEHMMLNITCSRLCTYAHTRKKMEEGMIVLVCFFFIYNGIPY